MGGGAFPAPCGTVKGAPVWSETEVDEYVAQEIVLEGTDYFTRNQEMGKVSKNLDEASKVLDEAADRFRLSMERFKQAEADVSRESKAAVGRVKRAANDLGDSMVKVSTRADFDRLQKQVEMLERAEKAMRGLAELNESGALEKISAALK